MSKARRPKSKKCPYCGVPLNLDVDTCFSCKKKVGKIDKYGMAQKPPDYLSYVICLAAWVGFYLYIKWAFF